MPLGRTCAKRVRISVRCVLDARAALITVSTGVLGHERIRFAPALPEWKRDAIAGLPMGSCNKIALGFAQFIEVLAR